MSVERFNEIANEWDSPEKIKLISTLADKVLEYLNLDTDLKILDIGCGTGLFGMAFIEYAKEIVGVDTSQGMLDVFSNKNQAKGKVSTININLEKEVLDESYDLILSSMAFHHLEKPRKVFEKIYNMLEDSGKAIIVDLDTEDGTFHPDNKEMGVKHFGFSKEELLSWTNQFSKREHKIIHQINKNDKTYKMFMLSLER